MRQHATPLLHVDHSLRAAVQDASSIFPVVQTSLLGNGCETPSCSAEYLALVSREILCGKLRLRLSGQSSSPRFCRGEIYGRKAAESLEWFRLVCSSCKTASATPACKPFVFFGFARAANWSDLVFKERCRNFLWCAKGAWTAAALVWPACSTGPRSHDSRWMDLAIFGKVGWWFGRWDSVSIRMPFFL